jgi:hypothetical protein
MMVLIAALWPCVHSCPFRSLPFLGPEKSERSAARERNLAEVVTGQPLTYAQQTALDETMTRIAGTDFFAPIGAQTGARFLNVPDVTGIDNKTFQQYVSQAVHETFGGAETPGAVEIRRHAADSGYLPID